MKAIRTPLFGSVFVYSGRYSAPRVEKKLAACEWSRHLVCTLYNLHWTPS